MRRSPEGRTGSHHAIGGQVYPYGEAKTKATLVTNFAREHQHPLRCVIERAPTK
jgi:ATP-dependent Clp protease adapter protein ClpS